MKKHLTCFLVLLILILMICVFAAAEISGGFEYRILDDGSIKLRSYEGTETNLVIPETLDGYTVSTLDKYFSLSKPAKELISITIPDTLTTIEPDAFSFTPKLKNIIISKNHPTLAFIDGVLYNKEHKSILRYLQSNTAQHFDVPDGIKLIEEGAFFRSQLISVNIPGSVEQINSEGFNQCHSLKELNMAEGLRIIESAVIFNCRSLETVTFPASVTDIGEYNCTDNLREIRVSPANPVIKVIDGALINQRDGLLIAFPDQNGAETYTVPEGIIRIGNRAFDENKHIVKINFPESLTSIGENAFLSCSNLTEIIMPDSITELGMSAFDCCTNVSHLHISAGLTEINDNFRMLGITELVIPETTTSIEGSFNRLHITDVVIPSNVTYIGANSFGYCHNLASITIPASVTKIDKIDYMFLDNSEDLIFKVWPGSYAEQYCKENQLKYEYIDGNTTTPEEDDPFSWLNP